MLEPVSVVRSKRMQGLVGKAKVEWFTEGVLQSCMQPSTAIALFEGDTLDLQR